MKKIVDIGSLLVVVKEFIKALVESRTYNIRKNWYCIFGILWGIPVPIVTIGIDLYSAGLPLSINTIMGRIIHHPIHIFFILHPLFFGIVFGAMGTVRHNKEMRIKEFEQSLIFKNRQLEEANKKLQELDTLKSDFLSMISHELRSPLTAIQGYITFLSSEKAGILNNTQKEYLKVAEEETDHLNHLIEELLDLSRIEKGEFKVNLEAGYMQEVVAKAIISLQSFAKERQVTLENNLPQDLPPVRADREKILQVVSNLLENAIKFNKSGGRVSVSFQEDGQKDKLIFCIADTGIGIAEDKQDKVFDRFYQIEDLGNRKYQGCGLGLAITKSILYLHSGSIWVESKKDLGSKFFFALQRYNK